MRGPNFLLAPQPRSDELDPMTLTELQALGSALLEPVALTVLALLLAFAARGVRCRRLACHRRCSSW